MNADSEYKGYNLQTTEGFAPAKMEAFAESLSL